MGDEGCVRTPRTDLPRLNSCICRDKIEILGFWGLLGWGGVSACVRVFFFLVFYAPLLGCVVLMVILLIVPVGDAPPPPPLPSAD